MFVGRPSPGGPDAEACAPRANGAAFCPPRLLVDIEVDLAAEGFPTFSRTLEAAIAPDDEADGGWSIGARIDLTDDLDGALPDPVEIDPEAVDALTAMLSVGGGSSSGSRSLSTGLQVVMRPRV